jgi:hypothetical protein
MTTHWCRDQMSRAQHAFGEKRDRTALKHVLEVLSVYPSEEWALRGAAALLKVNMETSHRDASKEPLTPTEMQDPRLNSLFCSCDILGCTTEWISAKVAHPDYDFSFEDPIGGQCEKCGKYFCRVHFGAGSSCPQCRRGLIAAPPANGRTSQQTIRLNKPLVHVLVLKEGTEASDIFVQKLFQDVAPDVFEDSPTGNYIPTGNNWPEMAVDLAWALLAKHHGKYLSEEYDVRPVELRSGDGTRVVMLKVFANRPKIVDPTVPARQTNTVNASAATQQTNTVNPPTPVQQTNTANAPILTRKTNVVDALALAQKENMEYFQTPLPGDGDGVCSDRECLCKGTRIPRGEGYIYISIDCCGFRWDCRRQDKVNTKIERLCKEIGTRIQLAPELTIPILVCEVGARKRRLDLDIAARDAKHWWATEQVPFRPTPRVGEREYAFEGRASPLGGRPSSQPVRTDKRLVHVSTLKEGSPASGAFFKEVFDSFAPDVLERWPPEVGSSHTGNTFYEPLEDVAMALLARDNGKYLDKEYDVHTDEVRHKDGARVVILRVFASDPKTEDSKAPTQQTKTVDAPILAQKENSGWLSKVRSLFASG